MEDRVRFYQASTSELYGDTPPPQNENSPFRPRSPYAAAKLYAYWMTVNYRDAYQLHASNGILFNHEGPTRGETFVTRKITRAVAAMEAGSGQKLYLGNLDARRDWGHARDFVEGMWRIVQQDKPDDYVLATTAPHRPRVAEAALRRSASSCGGMEVVSMKRIDVVTGSARRNRSARRRPTEVGHLVGDPRKARERLGWRHTVSSRISFAKWSKPTDSVFPKSRAAREVFMTTAGRLKLRFDGRPTRLGRGTRRDGRPGAASRAWWEDLSATVDRRALDLRRQAETEQWLAAHRPEVVFVAAATVGGILANDTRPAEFLYDNLLMESNVIEAARRVGVAKLLFLGSSCIYPRDAAQPIAESALLSGPLEPTNQWYAIAKIAGLKLCQAYRRQYGIDCIAAMPTNLYGPGDNFDPQSSHVIPALLRRIHEARENLAGSVTIWGTGRPRREFLHVDDCAAALVHLMKYYSGEEQINVGTGSDLTIRELAETIARVVNYTRNSPSTRHDPTARTKLLDVSRIQARLKPAIELEPGLRATYTGICTTAHPHGYYRARIINRRCRLRD
jgi:GDP-L-fucose synthase